MTGLASKWATDEKLVEEARKQDVKVHKKTTTSHANSATPDKKVTKLPSIWADAEYETVTPKENKPKYDKSTRKPRRPLETPPNSSEGHDHYTRKPQNSEGHDGRKPQTSSDLDGHFIRKPPSGPRAQTHKPNHHETHEKHTNHRKQKQQRESETEGDTLPPMSDAAKAFASRLGMGSSTSKKHADHHENKHNEKHTKESINPLAARLGAISVSKDKPSSKQKYETPKQKKQKEVNHLKQKQDEAKKLEEAKEKEDMLKFLDQLESKDMDWAEYDD